MKAKLFRIDNNGTTAYSKVIEDNIGIETFAETVKQVIISYGIWNEGDKFVVEVIDFEKELKRRQENFKRIQKMGI
jgi:hypothetical protein